MPKQLTFFGRPVPRFTTRRLTLFLFTLSLLALTLISTLTSAIPSPPSLSAYDRKISVEGIGDSITKSALNPFRQPSHPPPRQKNDEFAGTSWWADWKWLSVPFSSSLTLDEDRALLPPLPDRQPIYCYYDATIKKPRDEKDAESELLLVWRRAWWAHGFRPMILSAAEAMNNPIYDEMQRMEMDSGLKEDLMRWLAWDTMGGGLLSHYTLIPMGAREDPLLSFLRRGEYPQLTRWKNLGNALFAATGSDVKSSIRSILQPSKIESSKTVISVVPEEGVTTDKDAPSLAYYSDSVIEKKYPEVAKSAGKSKALGLKDLRTLINAHLHSNWQDIFRDGIEVLKPFPEHTSPIVEGATRLAQALVACPENPVPSSCPPNLSKCTPCSSRTKALQVSTPPEYHNASNLYTIGTVPHPWTLATVSNLKEDIDARWIRRDSFRDPWLPMVTNDLFEADVAASSRVVRFKEAVASEFATAHALWLTPEVKMPPDLGWYFGFAIPKLPAEDEPTKVTVRRDSPGPKPSDEAEEEEPPVMGPDQEADLERNILERAKKVVGLTKATDQTKLRASLEAWNLADTEAWKFVRAFEARRIMVRTAWEDEEAKYSRGSGSENGRSAWNRWQDAKEDKPKAR